MTLVNTAPIFQTSSLVGKATFDIGTTDQGRSMIVQPNDGHILIGGFSTDSNGVPRFSLIRLNADGTPDTTFSTDGKADFSFSGYKDSGFSLTLQSDGSILLAGYSADNNFNTGFSVIRIDKNGKLDTTFGTDGKALFNLSNNGDYGQSLTVLGDDSILVAGYSTDDNFNTDFSLIHLSKDGTIDTAFGTAGQAIVDIGSHDLGLSLSVQSNGAGTADDKILLVGSSDSGIGGATEFSVIRLNANGTLDTSFSTDGKATFNPGGFANTANCVALQADGNILVAGSSSNSSNSNATTDFSVIRLKANGELDTTFSTDGMATFDIANGNDTVYSMTVQTDANGKVLNILLAGTSYSDITHTYDFSLIRL
ncbi:MAG: hypothetical protein NTZ64_01325, partial [Polaromonas sp.]|nr:hypothetical protein [Polaromonas sp.]